MATIRAYTTIEQSRKLAEILPLESADMFYSDVFIDEKHKYNSHYLETYGFKTFEDTKQKESKHLSFLPCWSLAALLGVLPDHFYDETGRKTLGMDKGDTYYNIFYENKNSYIQKRADNPVDACYEMIIRLNELKLL